MKKYKVTLISEEGCVDYFVEEMRFTDEYFSRERFQSVVGSLFFWAAQSIEYKDIRAIVTCDDFITFIVHCVTTVDGSTIWADLSIDNGEEAKHYRRMTIAA